MYRLVADGGRRTARTVLGDPDPAAAGSFSHASTTRKELADGRAGLTPGPATTGPRGRAPGAEASGYPVVRAAGAAAGGRSAVRYCATAPAIV
jgi:hypothetical protein